MLLLVTGNAFGEEGVELLRESLEAKGLLDMLGSLSDDEGLESDGEEGEGESDGGDDSLAREEESEVSREEGSKIEEEAHQSEQSETVRRPRGIPTIH